MLKRIKNYFGIEGVKIQLSMSEQEVEANVITGTIHLSSLSEHFIESIEIYVIEKYKRGRGDNTLIDEFTLGDLYLPQNKTLHKDEKVDLDFRIPYQLRFSNVDKLANSNIFGKGLAALAKLSKGVKSTYRIEAKVNVQDVKFSPIVKEEIDIV